MEDLADTRLAQKISQFSGVGLVTSAAARSPPSACRRIRRRWPRYGLSLEDLRTVIWQRERGPGEGQFRGPRQSYTIGANDQLLSTTNTNRLIIAYRNGGRCDLSDVANVIDGVENSQQAAWMNTPGRDPEYSAAAGRQHHRRRRSRQEAPAATAGSLPAVGEGHGADRPHRDHPRLGRTTCSSS